MKKILLILFFSVPVITFSQSSQRKNSAYLQLWGNGLVISGNYERQFTKKPGINAQIGVGLGGNKPTFPIGLNYLFNVKNQKSFIETGFTIVFAEKDLLYSDFDFERPDNTYGITYVPSFGYRYHAKKGFMLKVLYSPVFTNLKTNWAYYGIGLGWRF